MIRPHGNKNMWILLYIVFQARFVLDMSKGVTLYPDHCDKSCVWNMIIYVKRLESVELFGNTVAILNSIVEMAIIGY